MSRLERYFYTDWEAMTGADWAGLIITVLVFVLMIGLYFYVLRPKNRERLERQRYIPFDGDEESDNGEPK